MASIVLNKNNNSKEKKQVIYLGFTQWLRLISDYFILSKTKHTYIGLDVWSDSAISSMVVMIYCGVCR